MKRAEIVKPKDPLTIHTYDEIPKAPPGGVVVKTSYCGICHSDIHLCDDEFGLGGDAVFKVSGISNYNFPAVLGHEISGVVHSFADGESQDDGDIKLGDKVIVYPWIGCQECTHCKFGQQNYCTPPLIYCLGCGAAGGYSEYVVVSKKEFLVKAPESVPLDIGCMLACSGLTGYHAVIKVKPTVEKTVQRKGKATLLIIGAGGLGLWCLQTARASLPANTKLIVADISAHKLQNAIAHGADDTVLWDPALSNDDIIKITKEKGHDGEIDAAIDFVNSDITSARGLDCLTTGGAIALVGLFGGALSVPLPLFSLSLRQIFGIYVGTLQELRDLVNLVAKAELKPPKITYVKLEEAPATLQKLRKGEITGRALIKF